MYTQTTDKQETTAEHDADVDDDDDEDDLDDDDCDCDSEMKAVLGRPPLPGGSLPRPYPRRTAQLPSPSSASLKLANSPISGELSNASKSSSAPIIMKKLTPPAIDSQTLV